jgi:hypothetical protein
MPCAGQREGYSSYSFFTSALYGGVMSETPRPRFTPGEKTLIPIVQEAGWTSELVSTQRLERNSFASAGDRTPIVQPVARLYRLRASRALRTCLMERVH